MHVDLKIMPMSHNMSLFPTAHVKFKKRLLVCHLLFTPMLHVTKGLRPKLSKGCVLIN